MRSPLRRAVPASILRLCCMSKIAAMTPNTIAATQNPTAPPTTYPSAGSSREAIPPPYSAPTTVTPIAARIVKPLAMRMRKFSMM